MDEDNFAFQADADTQPYRRGQMLFERHKYELAQEQFVEHLKLNPDDGDALAYISMCLLERGQKRKATQVAAQAIAADPECTLAYVAAAKAFRARKQDKEASNALKQALKLEPGRSDLLGLAAMLACDQRKWQEAIELTEIGLQEDPTDANCRLAASWAYMNSNRIQAAREILEAMLREDPADDAALTHLGWAAVRENRREEALEHFSSALREQPENELAREGFMEALRLQYPLYGLVVRYFMWMQALPEKVRWGILLLERWIEGILKDIARKNSKLRPLIEGLLFAWSIFSYLTWTARPVTNMLLRLNRYARRFLRPEEIMESNCVTAMLLSGSLFWLQWHFVGRTWALVGCIISFTMVIPISTAFSCPEGWPRKAMKAFAAVLFVFGCVSVWGFYDSPLTGGIGRKAIQTYGMLLMVNQLAAHFLERADVES